MGVEFGLIFRDVINERPPSQVVQKTLNISTKKMTQTSDIKRVKTFLDFYFVLIKLMHFKPCSMPSPIRQPRFVMQDKII